MNNMIYLDIHGRLGNQLFQYAFARYLMKYLDDKLTINFQSFINESCGQQQNGWEDSLRFFQTINYTTYKDKTCKKSFDFFMAISKGKIKKFLILIYFIIKKFPSIGSFKKIAINKVNTLLLSNNIFFESDSYTNFIPQKGQDVLLRGYFENPLYLNKIKNELIKEIRPKALSKKAIDTIERIRNTQISVCVSVRTYNEIRHNPKWFEKYNVCSENYFNQAMAYMNKIYENPTFFLFSDDINWVLSNYNIMNYYNIIPCNCFENSAEALFVMGQCQNFIISNSTYSWWGQYLSQNKQKKVVCPKTWNNYSNNHPLIDTNNWKLI